MEKSVLEVIKENNCSGCGTCAGVCPQNAIKITLNKDGFFRPEIDKNSCVNCGLCLKICAGFNEKIEERKENCKQDLVFGEYVNCYAGWAKDENIRLNSSTGGVIRELAVYYSDKFDGVISLTENENDALKPEVKVLKTKEELINLPKSKYFSVELSKAAEYLKNNSGHYLVIGLPCQIASLKKAQKVLKGTFNSIELFCGALFSHTFMEKYLAIHNAKNSKIDFRDKKTGWHNFSLTAGNSSEKADDDLFYFAQRNKIFTQERCLKCNLCHSGAADIMVGDFWGEKYANDDNGVNLLLARSNAGTALLENCEAIHLEKHNIQDVYESQPWFVKFFIRNTYKPNSLFEKLNNYFRPDSLRNVIKINKKMFKLINKKDLRKAYHRTVRKQVKLYKKFVKLSFLVPDIVKNKSNRILVIPPDHSFGSFGDQAMIFSIIENIKKQNPEAEIALFTMHQYWEKGIPLQHGYNIPIYSPDDYWKRKKLFKRLCGTFGTLYVVGADILDGGCGIKTSLNYFNLMNIAHKKGLKVIVNAFSFNDRNYPEIVKGIKKVSQYAILNARDSVSYERLQKLGCKNLHQTADIAFLFDESKYNYSDYCIELANKLKDEKSNGTRLIGLHLTSDKNKDYKPFVEKIANSLTQVQNSLVVILPHDKRLLDNKYTDEEFSYILEQELTKKGIKCVNTFNLQNEAEVKHIASLMNLVITSRMHLAIASLSRQVPVISFVYQGKFEGLYKFFKFKENLMFESNDFDSESLSNSVNYLLEDISLSSMLKESFNNVKTLAEENLKGIFYAKK